MYGAPMPQKPDLTGWKLVSDQAFSNGFAVGASLMLAACGLAFSFYLLGLA